MRDIFDAELTQLGEDLVAMSRRVERAVTDAGVALMTADLALAESVIADDLGISIKTVEAHRASIMDKTNSGTVADLMRVVMGTSNPPL